MELKTAKRFCAFVLLLSGELVSSSAGAQVFELSLRQAEDAVLSTSNTLKSAKATESAAEAGADAQGAGLLPKLTLNGNYYYQTNVPQLSLPIPNSQPFSFGDHNNYSFGPNLTYTLYDGGAIHSLWKSGVRNAEARNEEVELTKRQLILSIRQTYVKVQLSIENTSLTAKSLLLSKSRFNDVTNRYRAGSASRLDFVNAKRELLDYKVKLKQAQNALAADLRDLIHLTGGDQNIDYSRPWPQGLSQQAIAGSESPTTFLHLDPLSSGLADPIKSLKGPDGNHPQIKSLSDSADAARLSAKASSAGQWPKVTFNATSEYVYPNGPIIQQVQQNLVAVNVSVPLFEDGQSRRLRDQHESEAASFEFQKEQRLADLDRDFRKAKDLLDNLVSQEKLSRENAEETESAASLTYQSYRAGKQQYLDVETANLKSLEAQVALAEVRANILTTIAQLQYLSTGKEDSHE